MVSVKNHRHAAGNERAQHQRLVTVEEVLGSPHDRRSADVAAVLLHRRRGRGGRRRSRSRWRRRRRAVELAALRQAVGPPIELRVGLGDRQRHGERGVRRRRHRPPATSTCSRCTTPSRSARSSRSRRSAWPRSVRAPPLAESGHTAIGGPQPVNPSGGLLLAGTPARSDRAGPGRRDRVAVAWRGRAAAGGRGHRRCGGDDGWWHGRHRRQRVRRGRTGRTAMSSRVTDLDDDMLTPDRVADPYPFFDELRSTEPVHWSDRYRAWFISRWDDTLRGAARPALLVRPGEAGVRHQAHRRAADRPQADVRHPPVLDGLQRPARPHPPARSGQPGVHAQGDRRPAATDRGGGRRAARGRPRAGTSGPHPRLRLPDPRRRDRRDARRAGRRARPVQVVVRRDHGAGVRREPTQPGRREQAQRSLLDLAGYLHDLVGHYRRAPARQPGVRPDRRPGRRRPPDRRGDRRRRAR